MKQHDIDLLSVAAKKLPDWYRETGTALPWRVHRTPYRTWVSEIMLQQTRTTAVIPYFERFMAAYPTVGALADTSEEALLKLWEGLGYYSRARNLHRAARDIVDCFGGELPHSAKELRTLAGVGEYTAGAIASVCFGEPEPAVDGNVLRVVMRYLGSDADIALPATKREVTEALRAVYPRGERAGLLTEGLMELGEQLCIPNGEPRCLSCPLAEHCVGLREGTHLTLPKRSPKKPREIEERTILVLRNGDKGTRYAIHKRPDRGLLAGLWEFPSCTGRLTAADAVDCAGLMSGMPTSVMSLGEATHIFTHIEWHMIGYLIDCEFTPAPFTWATKDEILQTYAIPKAFRAYVERIT